MALHPIFGCPYNVFAKMQLTPNFHESTMVGRVAGGETYVVIP